ncbi:S-layer homology domain-containing protein [Oscillibacter sp. MSJ-2]|uniref:S-layer homology domain-containing protein n=1 Tax=Dysosmobacter acutus TaxID=2841504 RepID=A0ABS6FAT8_9FIRM|nr:S-layer homology domain-containing protein [Dysosmobacter acutus]MBU5627404.1 S-layer homology domain-containing protein [Dysosmobacter acutus]
MKSRVFKRFVSLLLVLVFSTQLVTPALAAVIQNDDGSLILTDENGNVIEEDWEAEFPYGTFVFENSQLATAEDAGEKSIKIYRLGGTVGKADITVTVAPVLSQMDDGSYSASTAACCYDYVMMVEDTLPIAAYQAYGQDVQPLAAKDPATISAEVVEPDTVDEEGNPVYGHTVLSLSVTASKYLWQAKNADGMWSDVGTEKTLDVDNDVLELGDIRCIYTVGGQRYCSTSYKGEVYVPDDDDLPAIPEDLERNPEKSFSVLDPEKYEIAPYGTYEFTMTFAEGESVKEIRILPVDDDEAENVELLALRISACKGGELYDTANTLAISIEDNEEQEPSFFAFETTDITVDKAAGTAKLTVCRTGALQYVTSVDYHTEDGTAVAGEDYSYTEGQLYFSTDMDEMTIEIPLINNGEVIAEEDSDLSFTVVLDNPIGGGNSAVVEGKGTARVKLYNSGESETPNLATMLYTPEADDVSGNTQTTGAIAPSGSDTVIAQPVTQESADVGFSFGRSGDVSALTYDLSATLNFNRTTMPISTHWTDRAALDGSFSSSAIVNDTQGLSYNGWDDYGQVSKQSDGYMGRYSGAVGKSNNRYLKWNKQTVENFDQLFTNVYAIFRGKTENNWANQYHTTSSVGLTNSASGNSLNQIDSTVDFVKRGSAGNYSNVSKTIPVVKGSAGLFIALGSEDVGWADTRDAGGSVYLKAEAARRVLTGDIKYLVHTADDDTITAAERTSLYKAIAPSISVASGAGGVDQSGNVYVGTTLTLSGPIYSSYQYIPTESGKTPLYLTNSAGDIVNTGTVGDDKSATLKLVGSNGLTFASGGDLSTSDDYTVNVVLNRVQKINVNVAPSVPRTEDGNLDTEQIQNTVDKFFQNASIELSYKVSQTPKMEGGNYTVPFKTETKYLTADQFSNTSTMVTSNGTVENLQYINFHLPHTDQILFNGEAYAGDALIPISMGMFGMNELTFTYYASDYVSVESDMTLSIGRIEHYIDYNGNGQIDGELTDANQFILTPVVKDGVEVYDVLVEVLDEDQYNITEFLPVFGADGQPVQHFLKFYYNMTPRCLSVPAGYKSDDPAQILPSFVTSITDSAAFSALSKEMQGFRFIDSGKYTSETVVYNNSKKPVITHAAGSYSGDGKLMFGAVANSLETVDVPLGGDCGTPTPTYIYMDGDGEEHETKDKPSVVAKDPNRSDWYLADAKFLREDWSTAYRGNLLYEFHDPAAVFISDPLYGDMLPVAAEDKSGNYSSGYDAAQTNLYLGSFNPNDTVALCIRPQSETTDEIHASHDLYSGSADVSALDETIESGEYRISVDSVNPAGFKTVPDGSNLRVMTSPDAGSNQSFDSSASSSAFSEFNMDMGIELPSMSFAVTDYVTLIIDGDEIGFSIGVPLASCKKEQDYYTKSQTNEKLSTHSFIQNTKAEWETGNPVSENIDQAQGILDNLNPKGEQWQSIKSAQSHRMMKKDSNGHIVKDPKTGKPQYNDKLLHSSSKEFSLAFNVTVMFKYSPVDNTYHFTSAMIFLQFGFEYRKEVRLGVCPIIYAYVVVGVSLEAAGGVINEREVVEVGQGTSGYIDINSGTSSQYTLSSINELDEWRIDDQDGASGKKVANGAPGCSIEFICNSDAFNAYFSGTLKIEKQTGSSDDDWECLGYIRSDGSEPVLVMLDEKVNGTESSDIPVRLTVLDARAEVDTIVAIEKIRNDTYFSGLSLTPCAYMEVGAGIGVECLKAEIYFKASISITMSFFTRQNNAATKGSNLRDPSSSSVSVMGAAASLVSSDDMVSAFGGEVEKFSFDNFKFRAGFGVRVVLLFFNFEMDMIQFGIDYSKEYDMNRGGDDGSEDGFKSSGWKFAWYAFNETTDVATYGLDDEDEGFPGIKITIPANTFTAQQIFGPEYADQVMDEIEALAFDPENLADNAFQISGYSSSGDAFRLAEGLGSGADYQLLTVGNTNYLLYTISRDPSSIRNAVDSNMLVLSKIQNTGAEENIGLVNPVDGGTEPAYIVVDNDNTGDLDFSGQVNGNTIYVSWVSYASQTAADGSTKPTMPDADVYRPSYTDSNDATVYMNNVNYEEAAFKPVEPTLGVTEPTAPKQTDYYLTADEFDALGEEQQSAYTQDADSGNYYNTSTYETYTAAEGAYNAALAQYATDKAAYDAAEEEYKAAYQTYSSLKAAYDAWYGYYAGNATASASTQELLANSARNTVIKTASFTVGGTDNGFTEPEVVAEANDGAYKFLPSVSPDGKLTFFARSNNYTSDEKTAATDKAKDYYEASKGDVSTDANGLSTGSGDPSAAFRYAYTTSTDDVYGKNTQFFFSYQTDDGKVVTTGWTPKGWEQAGMRLSSVDIVMLDDTTFYLAYTATQTVTSVSGDSYSDANVHKLYLQKGSVDTATGAVTLETAKMLRTLVDLNESGGGDAMINSLTGTTGVSKDGVYRNTDGNGLQLVEEHNDPYFGTVKFLQGKLGNLTGEEENFGESLSFTALDTEESLFLMFEMNGMAYVVPETSLASITDPDQGSGCIIPFFAPTEENSGRGSMDIGVDGDGNISAVYTSTVPYTTNNAIYVSKYDANTQKFGEGRMLAMNQMQVYEDSIANCWNAEETEQAYYGKLEGYETDERGLMTSFTFSDLAVALGLTKTPETSEDSESAAGTVDQSTLVILARGTKTELEETEFYGEKGTKIVTSKYKDDGTMDTTTGIYVLSFGVGEKSVGEASITFESPNFVTGARLRPVVSFKNTGDVSLLGSEANPITVKLCISDQSGKGFGEELFTWEITENIAVGQTVTTQLSTGDYTKALPENLVGREIYFTVSEDTEYVDSPLEYSSLDGGVTRKIENKPELAVEDLKFSTLGVETVGSEQMVKIGVDMKVTNRGAANAVAPYIQFAYQSGRTMEEVKEGDTDYQKAVYSPLDITNSSFEISNQTPIEAASADDDKQNGILRLVGKDGEDLKAGYERTVSGTILVPKDAYCLATATGSLNLVVSVFDDNTSISSLSADGLLVSAFDNEYVPDNNAVYDSLEPTSFFSAPQKLTIPLGTTMRLALPVTTTEQTVPVIEVNELNCQAQATNESHMGILYYNMGSSGTGADGYLVLSPSDEGSGIIRVADKNTNAWVDISYTVTEAGSGVNIFKDNGRFTWYNARGQQIDPETDESGAWVFPSAVAQWGSGEETTVPYLGDTSNAKMRNTSFTFDTLAETIDLYFDGSIQVSCNDEDVETQNLTATGGKGEGSYATINLGSNPANKTRRVTVRVNSDSAVFDYMVEHFAGNLPIMPDVGGEAPQIYFSRIMPETASLDPAKYPDGFSVTVYIVDENGLAQATLDPGSSNAATANYSAPNDNFRQFDVVVKRNGTFAVSATDTTGNTSSRTIMVDWFNSTVSATDEPLVMERNWVYLNSGNESIAVADDAMLKKDQFAYLDVLTKIGNVPENADTTLEYYQITVTTVTTSYELVEKEITGETGEDTEEAPVPTTWVLRKTVTTVDGKGNLVGDPEITDTPADATTVVPASSVSVETRGVWEKVEPVQIGDAEPKTTLYPVVQNGVYKLTAELDGKYANEIFLMNRLNSDLPSIRLGYVEAESVLSAPSITYSATKGESSSAGLAQIKLDDYVIATADNADVMKGSIQVLYNGSYKLTAVDGAGNEQDATKEIEDISLMAQNDAITVNAATNNAKDNGSISIDASKLMGGSYDSIDADGVHNVYQIALIPSAENYNGTVDGFGAFADGLNWKSTELGGVSFEDLTPGVYVLYVRDAEDTPDPAVSTEEDYLIRKLTVNDHSVNFTTTTTSSSITVKATGAERYEYIVFPVDSTEMTAYSEIDELIEQSRTAAEANAQAAKEAAVAQAEKDLASIADTTSEEYKAAEKQLAAIENSDISSFIDQNELINWKSTNYFSGLTNGQQYQVVVRDAADPTRYKAALVTAVSSSGGGGGSSLGSIISGETFTEKEEAEIIKKNQADDVVIENEKYIVIIPQRTLESGDSVNSLLLSVPSDLSIADDGIVVSCTTADGSTYIVPWCMVENEKVLYLALEPGDYALVNNAKHFSDIDSHWAKTYIDFVTARELFKGTGENVFSPNLTMTRAMFVTVLGRMANVDTANYDGSRFRDVQKNSWCSAYVEWAADNGIVSGYGDGSFRPNNPVTREQMAKILYHFARLMGEETTSSGNLSRYTDQTQISEWAIDPCSWATDCGLLQGREDGSFDPSGLATRGEVSALLKRFVEHIIQRIYKAGSNN